MKKVLALIIALVMVLGMTGVAFALDGGLDLNIPIQVAKQKNHAHQDAAIVNVIKSGDATAIGNLSETKIENEAEPNNGLAIAISKNSVKNIGHAHASTGNVKAKIGDQTIVQVIKQKNKLKQKQINVPINLSLGLRSPYDGGDEQP